MESPAALHSVPATSSTAAVTPQPPPLARDDVRGFGQLGPADNLRGCYVKTRYGWGICTRDDPEFVHLQVDLDWRLSLSRRVRSSIRRCDVLARSFCAAGACVQTKFGTGVVLCFRPVDMVHKVQLWGPLSKGRNYAYLRSNALVRVLPASAGLAVQTPFGDGVCRGYKVNVSRTATTAGTVTASSSGRLIVDLTWGEVHLAPSTEICCHVASALPMIDRFIQRAAEILKLHSGTLARLREALQGMGLERLQEKLTSTAGEAMEMVSQLWDEMEYKDTQEVIDGLRVITDPKVDAMLKAGVKRLNLLAAKAAGFDGTWLGKEDKKHRCIIKDAVITWHWGEESELEIWSNDHVSTELEDESFRGILNCPGELQWTDGDIWVLSEERPSNGASEISRSISPAPQDSEAGQEAEAALRARFDRGLGDLRRIVQGNGLEGDVDEALNALSVAAAGDSEVQQIVSSVQSRHEALLEYRGQVLESKTGQIVLEARSRLSEHIDKLQESELSPQLQRLQVRGGRLITRISTDRKVKCKAIEIFSAAQNRITARWNGADQSSAQGIEAWVTSAKQHIMGRLSAHQATMVESLNSGEFGLQEKDFRQLIAKSWDTAALEAQLEESLVRAICASGGEMLTGTELLDRFENSAFLTEIPLLSKVHKGLIGTLAELSIEVPMPVQKLLEAQAAGSTQDVNAWQAAIMQSLDSDSVVQGASDLLKKGEEALNQLQGLKDNKTVATVMEAVESHDIERSLLANLHDLDADELINNAEGALTSVQARERLVSQLKDKVLDFILKVLPAIRIEQLTGHDNGCDWEISNINFSDFSFRKENVHIVLGTPGAANEDLIRVSAWDIGAHFRDLKVSVKQTSFPFIEAEGKADARANRMSVSLAFRWQHPTDQAASSRQASRTTSSADLSRANDLDAAADVVDPFPDEPIITMSTSSSANPSGKTGGEPPAELVVSSRAVFMQTLELNVGESNYSMIVNALSYIFSDVLKDYACQKITQQLDHHTGALLQALNTILASSAPVLARIGWELPAASAAPTHLGAAGAAALAALPPLTQLSAEEAEDLLQDDDDDEIPFLDWPDPGRAFAVRV